MAGVLRGAWAQPAGSNGPAPPRGSGCPQSDHVSRRALLRARSRIDGLEGHRRQHNIGTRAKALRDIEQMPHACWRLHQVAKDAYANTVTTMKINKILEQKTGVPEKLLTTSHEALAHVAEILSRSAGKVT